MTVGELREKLKEFDQNLIVEIPVPHPEDTGQELISVELSILGEKRVCLHGWS